MHSTARLFKALSEPTRLRILGLLSRGECCVCEIESVLDLPQSTVSRNLSSLRNSGLVQGRRKGVWMYYRLQEPVTELHGAVLNIIRDHLPELPEIEQDLLRLSRACTHELKQCCPPQENAHASTSTYSDDSGRSETL